MADYGPALGQSPFDRAMALFSGVADDFLGRRHAGYSPPATTRQPLVPGVTAAQAPIPTPTSVAATGMDWRDLLGLIGPYSPASSPSPATASAPAAIATAGAPAGDGRQDVIPFLQSLSSRSDDGATASPAGTPAVNDPASSPFQTLLERAIARELAQPQGRYQSFSRESTMYPHARRFDDPLDFAGRGVAVPTGPLDQSLLPQMIEAGNQADQVANATRGQRLGALVSGYGQVGVANADMARSQVEADKLAFMRSPAGLRYAAILGGVGAGSVTPQSDPETFGKPPDPETALREHLGVKPETPLPDFDTAVQRHLDAGGAPILPGSPLFQGAQRAYGDVMRARLAGAPSGMAEQAAAHLPVITDPGLGPSTWLLKSMVGDTGAKASRAQQAFGRVKAVGAPASVGVLRSPERKPKVSMKDSLVGP